MKLTGLHLLLTYECNLACSHCFVWGSPWQRGTMTGEAVDHILGEAKDLSTVQTIYFEGGEPFLYYQTLIEGIKRAAELGFDVGIVSNAYWATSEADARAWLEPMAGLLQDLSLSSDLYHWREKLAQRVRNARVAAQELGIPVGTICIAQPQQEGTVEAFGQLSAGESAVMYRGRAAVDLVDGAGRQPAEGLTRCPYEDLRDPGRVHVDPLGNIHICQGIVIGNLFERPLSEIVEEFEADAHPITGPLLAGGPLALANRYELSRESTYADACHFCYEARTQLRERLPAFLAPDQMYGHYN